MKNLILSSLVNFVKFFTKENSNQSMPSRGGIVIVMLIIAFLFGCASLYFSSYHILTL